MESKQRNKSQDQGTEKLKEIPKWTRKYAQNRTLPFLVTMAIFLLLFLGIAGPSYFGGKAYKAGDMPVFWICIFVVVIADAALIFFCIPKWGGKFIVRISRRLYGEEGIVSLPLPERIKERVKKRRWLVYVVGLVFACCVVASVLLGMLGYIPIEYMQPVSAIYCVPFLVLLAIWQRPMIGPLSPLSLLWPALYAAHAVLVVVGAPIQFSGQWQGLNMLIPVVGYGALSGLLGHIYSRYALKRLKKIAHLEEGGD